MILSVAMKVKAETFSCTPEFMLPFPQSYFWEAAVQPSTCFHYLPWFSCATSTCQFNEIISDMYVTCRQRALRSECRYSYSFAFYWLHSEDSEYLSLG